MDSQTHLIDKWGLLIAHPPCTYLTAAGGVRLFKKDHTIKNPQREKCAWEAKDFFMQFLNCGIEKIAVENPTPMKYFGLPKYSQIIEPYMFGDPWRKRTCLWLVNLPKLQTTDVVEPLGLWVDSGKSYKGGYTMHGKRNPKDRAKTFPGIAKAMAEQWGCK